MNWLWQCVPFKPAAKTTLGTDWSRIAQWDGAKFTRCL